MTTPVVVLTGITPDAMTDVMLSLQWDTPHAVAVRHTIDVERQVLTRVVSDVSGVVERVEIDLDHACVGCAVREDVVPTLLRLAEDGRWRTILAHLPLAAEATQLCHVVEGDLDVATSLHVAAVVAVVDGPRVRSDLLGDDLLRDRDVQTSSDDGRGVAETQASLVEYADVVLAAGDLDDVDHDLLVAIARPTAMVVADHYGLSGEGLAASRRPHEEAEAWVDPGRCPTTSERETGLVWTLELTSDRPFHPERLHEHLLALGGGARRSRGCFWLPTRPSSLCQWDGAGGQLSVGVCEHGPFVAPHTAITVTGIDDDRDAVREAFARCLLTHDEVAARGTA